MIPLNYLKFVTEKLHKHLIPYSTLVYIVYFYLTSKIIKFKY